MTIITKPKRKIFYGWWMVLASTLAMGLGGGLYFYGFSTFFMPLVKEFGWTRAALSGAFSLSRIEGGLLGPAGGFLIDRFGPRKMMLLGVILMGAGFLYISGINSLPAFYLAFVLGVATGSTLGLLQAPIVATVNWFIRKRGMAMGILMSGVGLGGILLPGLAWLITQHGWRHAAFITGLAVWIIGIPLALVLRHKPEQYGYLPDGEVSEDHVQSVDSTLKSKTTGVTNEHIDFTPKQALRTPVFWLLALAFGLRQLVISAVVLHQIPFLTGLGFSEKLAAGMLGTLAMVSVVGRLGFGRLGDIFEKRYIMSASLALLTIGCLILVNAQTLWHIILFLAIYSPAYGGGVVLMFAIRGEYFGRQHFGTISGLMDLFQMFGLVAGPVFAGWVYDVTGSYRQAFLTFAIAAAVAAVLILFLRRPRRSND